MYYLINHVTIYVLDDGGSCQVLGYYASREFTYEGVCAVEGVFMK